jgi:WD40 repeat protein
VTFDPAGTQIVSGGLDGSLRVWDAVGGLPIPAGQGAEVRTVAFRPNENGSAHDDEIASGGTNGTVMLWNPRTGAPTGRLGNPSNDYEHTVNTLAYSPSGDRILTGGQDGALHLWDLSTLTKAPRTRDAPDLQAEVPAPIRGVAFNTDGTLAISSDMQGNLKLWDGRTLAPLGEATFNVEGPDGPVPLQWWSVAFSRTGQVATGSGFGGGGLPNLIQVWNVDRSQRPDKVLTRSGEPISGDPGFNVYTVKFDDGDDRDGKIIVAGTNQGTITLWNVPAGDRRGEPMSGDQNAVMSIALAPKHPWMVSGALDGKVRFWDRDKHEPIGTPIEAHGDWVHSVAISPDEQSLVSGGADGTIHLWQAPLYNLTDVVCDKLNSNMSQRQWKQYLPWIPYRQVCPGKPVPEG